MMVLRRIVPPALFALLATACGAQAAGTTIGPEVPVAAATSAAAPAPAASTSPAPATTPARAPATTTTPTLTAPDAFVRAGFELPQDPPDGTPGTATVTGSVPRGWAPRTTKTQGYGEPDDVVTIDRRDPTGEELVRYKYEPATGGGPGALPSDDGSLDYVINQYRQQAGVVVTVTAPPYTAKNGLPEAEWSLDLSVGGVRRHVLVAAWVLNDQVLSTYVSVPVGSEDVGRTLYQHSTDILVVTHVKPA